MFDIRIVVCQETFNVICSSMNMSSYYVRAKFWVILYKLFPLLGCGSRGLISQLTIQNEQVPYSVYAIGTLI